MQVLASGVAVLGALLLGAGPVASGSLPAVWLPVIVLLPLATFEAIAALPAAAVEAVRGSIAAQRLLALLDDAVPPPEQATSERVPGRGPHRLTAQGLSCAWPGSTPVVTDVDLDLAPGLAVAVLGASGTGKTTLLLTLAGLLPPAAGAVRLDGVDLAAFDQDRLRSTVSCTVEDAHVFSTTVRENLRVAAGDVDDGVLLRAIDDVDLGSWVRTLPAGLGTLIGSDGHDVSGGERRRLLVARALLTGAAVLLLDEAAEHLDPASGDRLVRDLARTARRSGRCLVVVTHSGATLDAFDDVVVVGDGRARTTSSAPSSVSRETTS